MSEASKPDLTMKVTQRGNPTIVTVRIQISTPAEAHEAMTLINSVGLKQQVYDGRHEHQLGDYGMQNGGAPRPIFAKPDDRSSLIAYERDFKFTRNV